MKQLVCLEYFLAAGFSYKEAAQSAGMTTAKFRATVFEELAVLSKVFVVSWHPLRHAHLRHQESQIRELLGRYRELASGKPGAPAAVTIDHETTTYENCHS